MKILKKILILLLLILTTMPLIPPRKAFAVGDNLTGIVTYISDADTLKVRVLDSINLTLRAAWIDAPEIYHKREKKVPLQSVISHFDWGQKSLDALLRYIKVGDEIKFKITGIDYYYGRQIAEIYLPNTNGDTLQKMLLRSGLAETFYVKTAPIPELDKLQASAKAARRGIWSDPSYLSPGEVRKLISGYVPDVSTPKTVPGASIPKKEDIKFSIDKLSCVGRGNCNCKDFQNQEEAAFAFDYFKDLGEGDKFGLDRNKDEIACNSLRRKGEK